MIDVGKIHEALEKSQSGIPEAESSVPDPPSEQGNGTLSVPADESHPGNGFRRPSAGNGPGTEETGIPVGQHRTGDAPGYGRLDSSLVTEFRPHSLEAEQFRILKTSILFPDRGDPPRSIMVTSTVPGEGKSFVATNLAISIAKSIDEYVLLIDADLRRPSVHKRFGFPDDTPGLSEHLSKGVDISLLLRKTAIDKLTILPCGEPPANPAELVSSEQMKRLILEVRSRYKDRYIIIDSPPPYLTSEANALARQVDGIVIVMKCGSTKKEAMQDLIDTYGREKILGVVKNFAPLKRSIGYKHTYVYH